MYKKHIKIAHQGTLDVLLIKVANIEQQCVSIRPQLRGTKQQWDEIAY